MWLRQILKTISAYRKVKIRDGEGEDRREREGGRGGKIGERLRLISTCLCCLSYLTNGLKSNLRKTTKWVVTFFFNVFVELVYDRQTKDAGGLIMSCGK